MNKLSVFFLGVLLLVLSACGQKATPEKSDSANASAEQITADAPAVVVERFFKAIAALDKEQAQALSMESGAIFYSVIDTVKGLPENERQAFQQVAGNFAIVGESKVENDKKEQVVVSVVFKNNQVNGVVCEKDKNAWKVVGLDEASMKAMEAAKAAVAAAADAGK